MFMDASSATISEIRAMESAISDPAAWLWASLITSLSLAFALVTWKKVTHITAMLKSAAAIPIVFLQDFMFSLLFIRDSR